MVRHDEIVEGLATSFIKEMKELGKENKFWRPWDSACGRQLDTSEDFLVGKINHVEKKHHDLLGDSFMANLVQRSSLYLN